MTFIHLARRLAGVSPRAKIWIMLAGDALFLPLCMLAAVSLRLGSLDNAIATAPWAQIILALVALPALVPLAWVRGGTSATGKPATYSTQTTNSTLGNRAAISITLSRVSTSLPL